jgi:hypothetical protein
MYRNYPKTVSVESASEEPLPDWIEGHCLKAPQVFIQFGSNRKELASTRPVISFRKRDGYVLVLPATTKANAAFFMLKPDDCFCKNKRKMRTGYISPRWEPVRVSYTKHFREIGWLPHPIRIQVADWLKSK